MQSEGSLSNGSLQSRVKTFGDQQWGRLTDRQRGYAKRLWGILTYKWRWQIAMNIPYLLIFCLDRTVPAVHQFDMRILTWITSKIPLPEFFSVFTGIG